MKYAIAAIGVMVILSTATARGVIKSENVEYRIGDTTFKSVVVYDDGASEKRPGIVVYPEWWGLTDYAKRRAHMLAEMGYVAMAVDLFGNGQTTDDAATAGKWAGALKGDRKVLRQRANAGLEQLKKNSHVDPSKLGAIGYCFGGATAIELGRSGADVKAIVTFHAALDSPTPADGKNIKGRLLVCHGGDDNFETPKDLAAFEDEMRQNHVDWEMNVYGGAVHSFTNPDADKHGIPGIAYNKRADDRSWQDMKTVFHEVFGPQGSAGR